MTADIVNLRRARKNRARAGRAAEAAANRIRFGRGKTERERHETAEDLARRRLDAHRLGDRDDDEPGGGRP